MKSRSLWVYVLVGLIGGFGGAALLVTGSAGAGVPVGGMLVAVAATLCWTVGSLYARTAPLPKAPLLGSGMQQMVGGAVILAVALAIGEGADLDLSAVTTSSWLGLAWLIVAGSFVGFSAYLWLLRNVRTTLVSTYAYVNPIVAVTLGGLVLPAAAAWAGGQYVPGRWAYYFLPRAELVPLVSATLLMRLVRTLPHTIRAGRDLALFEVLELYLAITALVLIVTLRRRLLGSRPASTPGRE